MLATTLISDPDANKHATTHVEPANSPPATSDQTTDLDATKPAPVITTHVEPANSPPATVDQTTDLDATKPAPVITTHVEPANSAPETADQTTNLDATKPAPVTTTHAEPVNSAPATIDQTTDLDATKPAPVITTHVEPANSAQETADQTTNLDATKPAPVTTTHGSDQNPLPPAVTQPTPTTASETPTNLIPDPNAINHEDNLGTGTGSSSSPPTDAAGVPAATEQIQPTATPETVPESSEQIHDATKVSTSSNQDTTDLPNLNPPANESDISSTKNPPTDKDPQKQKASTDSATTNNLSKNHVDPATQEKSRKDLENLIEQNLSYVDKISEKLGAHGQRIKTEVEEARKKFEDLKKSGHELKELKDLKKIVTKIMLQIPAKYRTYGESDQEKNKRTDLESKVVSWKTLKEMPIFHDHLFHKNPFCRTIQKRYNDLRIELKLCLLCFTVFPENAEISRRLMVYWWIGEGLISPSEEDHANGVFKELMDHDFIEPVSKRHGRKVAVCRMHPMVRAALVMIAHEIRFFEFDEYGNPKDFGKFDELESPEDMPSIYPIGDPREFFEFYYKDGKPIPPTETIEFFDSKGNQIPFAKLETVQNPVDRNGNIIDIGQKYYFYSNKTITRRLYKVCLMGSGLSNGITWEKLHLLFNVKDDILEFKPEWFLRMKNVNMLFLGRWQSSAAHHIEVEDFDFNKSLDRMSHVRFFSLQGVSRVSEIPKSISKLESLLILDLRACHNLEVIPRTIGSLKCLTHLDMSECYLLKAMPKEISTLVSLQVLKGFKVDEDSKGKQTCTLQDLKKLEYLRKLSMYTHMKDFPQDSHLDALNEFESLRKLTILWSVHDPMKNKTEKPNLDAEEIKLTPAKPSPKKQRVKRFIRRMNAFNTMTLGSRIEKLDLKCFPDSVTPDWLTPARLKGLKKLYIRGGKFSDIGQFQDVLEWDTSSVRPKETWNVEVLRLKYLDELEMEWKELQNLFPKMTSLEKVKCPRLMLFPCNAHGIWTKKKSMAA